MIPASPLVTVAPDGAENIALHTRANALATQLNLPLGSHGQFVLTVTVTHLELRLENDRGLPVFCDLSKIDVKSSVGRSLKQPLAKALGIKRRSDPPLRVLDACAGWGEDAWLMLGLGCCVQAIERHPIMAVLLEDTLMRAVEGDPQLASRVTVTSADAITQMQAGTLERPDIVYLDPMFPTGRKTAPKKKLRVIRELVGDDPDTTDLFEAAKQIAGRRVVVKRPPKAPFLAGATPVVSHRGKGVRYDVYPQL